MGQCILNLHAATQPAGLLEVWWTLVLGCKPVWYAKHLAWGSDVTGCQAEITVQLSPRPCKQMARLVNIIVHRKCIMVWWHQAGCYNSHSIRNPSFYASSHQVTMFLALQLAVAQVCAICVT